MNRRVLIAALLAATSISMPFAQDPGREAPAAPPMAIPKDDARIEKLKAAAVADVEPGEWLDPVVLERLAKAAMLFTLADGEQKVQDLKLGAR